MAEWTAGAGQGTGRVPTEALSAILLTCLTGLTNTLHSFCKHPDCWAPRISRIVPKWAHPFLSPPPRFYESVVPKPGYVCCTRYWNYITNIENTEEWLFLWKLMWIIWKDLSSFVSLFLLSLKEVSVEWNSASATRKELRTMTKIPTMRFHLTLLCWYLSFSLQFKETETRNYGVLSCTKKKTMQPIKALALLSIKDK